MVPSRFRDKPTADLIVIFLAALVGIIMLLMSITLIVVEIWYPDHDITTLATRVGTLTSSLIGAIIGYLAGRGVTPNGKSGVG